MKWIIVYWSDKPPKETKPKKAAKPKKKSTDDSDEDKPKKATKKRPAKNFSDSDFSEDGFVPKKTAAGKKVNWLLMLQMMNYLALQLIL